MTVYPTTHQMQGQEEVKTRTVLEEDPIKLAGQRWALISVVGGESAQKHTDGIYALKIRGVFETQEDANRHAKNLVQVDPHFDIYMVDMYRWLAIPPNRSEVAEKCGEVYQEEQLNDIIQDYKEQQRRVSQAYEERKQSMIERAHKDNESRREALGMPSNETQSMDESDTAPSDVMESMTQTSDAQLRDRGESSSGM